MYDRRQFLTALGLGALATALPGRRKAHADTGASPSRIVFYVQPHGHIPKAIQMAIPGGPTDRVAERGLASLTADDLSPTLRALQPFAAKLLAVEGLSRTSALADIADVMRTGGDLNNHQIGVAHTLTGARALQRPGTFCTGGAASIDQVIASRLRTPGRFDSRVYGFDYVPNTIVSPFSYLGPGQATPMVSDPGAALDDLLGYVATPTPERTRADKLRALRPSVLDAVAREYEVLAPKLGEEARRKLEQHRALVRDLELALASKTANTCDTSFDRNGQSVRQFMRLIRLAFACDLTRVVTFSAPVPLCPEIGYPADTTVHTYAHQSVEGNTSCGQLFNPVAERAMIDLDAWHSAHIAALCQELDSVAEGDGTLLDHTVIVWLSELATPTHQHHDAFAVLVGGASSFFRTGRYVRYPRTAPNPLKGQPLVGPAHNRLLVTLLAAMGQTDDSFGMTGAVAADGSSLSFTGALAELRR